MRKNAATLLLVPLLCLVSFPAASYAQNSDAGCRKHTKYDATANRTTVECNLLEVAASPVRLMLTAKASYQGKEPNETAKFSFHLAAFRGAANRHTQLLFKDATTLSLTLETTHLELPVTEFHTDFFELNRLLAEQAQASVDRENLRKLLATNQLAGKWGSAEFKLSDASLLSLKKFIADQVAFVDER